MVLEICQFWGDVSRRIGSRRKGWPQVRCICHSDSHFFRREARAFAAFRSSSIDTRKAFCHGFISFFHESLSTSLVTFNIWVWEIHKSLVFYAVSARHFWCRSLSTSFLACTLSGRKIETFASFGVFQECVEYFAFASAIISLFVYFRSYISFFSFLLLAKPWSQVPSPGACLPSYRGKDPAFISTLLVDANRVLLTRVVIEKRFSIHPHTARRY